MQHALMYYAKFLLESCRDQDISSGIQPVMVGAVVVKEKVDAGTMFYLAKCLNCITFELV